MLTEKVFILSPIQARMAPKGLDAPARKRFKPRRPLPKKLSRRRRHVVVMQISSKGPAPAPHAAIARARGMVAWWIAVTGLFDLVKVRCWV